MIARSAANQFLRGPGWMDGWMDGCVIWALAFHRLEILNSPTVHCSVTHHQGPAATNAKAGSKWIEAESQLYGGVSDMSLKPI